MYVDDLSSAIYFIINKKFRKNKRLLNYLNKNSLINVGSGNEYSIKKFATKIAKVVNCKSKLKFNKNFPDGMLRKILEHLLTPTRIYVKQVLDLIKRIPIKSISHITGGGLIDNILMRIAEALLSIPQLFILIVLSRVLGTSVLIITTVIGVLSWMRISRLVRANVLSLRERDYVTAARAQGAPVGRILMRHIVPNTLAPIVVAGTLQVGRAIVLEASLSFLGMGVQPPTATWGSMLNRAQAYLTTAPWIAIAPGVMILVVVLCVNFLGDGLRDALDPQSYR